jgi:hypothetical protein
VTSLTSVCAPGVSAQPGSTPLQSLTDEKPPAELVVPFGQGIATVLSKYVSELKVLVDIVVSDVRFSAFALPGQ